MPHIFIHSSVDGHLGCFILLWMMLQWTQECIYFFEILISIILDIYWEMELLDHIVVLFFFFFWEISMMCSIVAALFYISTNSAQGHKFLHILSNSYCLLVFFGWFIYLFCFVFLVIAILTGLKLYLIVLMWIFLMISWATFHILVAHFYIFFRKISFQCSFPIFQYGYWFLAIEL